jgi:TetR/AcrR family transcriptional regulator, lmrAB and yxaGH operons repressor
MPAPLIPRDEVVDRLARVFRAHGYEGASLKLLSDATGLGRSSLYHHFPNGKEDMAAAVLARSGERFAREVVAPLRGEGDARLRLRRTAEGLRGFYGGGEQACLIDLFGIGPAAARFRPALAAAARGFTEAVAEVLAGAGVDRAEAARRAEDALVAVQGSLVLARATGSPEPFRRVLRELPDRLLG